MKICLIEEPGPDFDVLRVRKSIKIKGKSTCKTIRKRSKRFRRKAKLFSCLAIKKENIEEVTIQEEKLRVVTAEENHLGEVTAEKTDKFREVATEESDNSEKGTAEHTEEVKDLNRESNKLEVFAAKETNKLGEVTRGKEKIEVVTAEKVNKIKKEVSEEEEKFGGVTSEGTNKSKEAVNAEHADRLGEVIAETDRSKEQTAEKVKFKDASAEEQEKIGKDSAKKKKIEQSVEEKGKSPKSTEEKESGEVTIADKIGHSEYFFTSCSADELECKFEMQNSETFVTEKSSTQSFFNSEVSKLHFKALFQTASCSGWNLRASGDPEVEMECEPTSSAVKRNMNKNVKNSTGKTSESTSLDDSVVIVESKSDVFGTKDRRESISVIHELVVISDAEEENQKRVQLDSSIAEIGQKSKDKSVLFQHISNDIICVKQSINRPRKKRTRWPDLSSHSPLLKRSCTIIDSTDLRLDSIQATPDLKIITDSATGQPNCTEDARSSSPARDFIPLCSQKRKRRKKLKDMTFSTACKNSQNIAFTDGDLYITSVKSGNLQNVNQPNVTISKSCSSSSNVTLLPNKENSKRKRRRFPPLPQSTSISRSIPLSQGSVRKLRPVVIDGSNVAYTHGKKKFFSCRGIEICVNFFQERGHKVTAFVPQFRRRHSQEVVGQEILERLGDSQVVVFTPSRTVNGVLINSYDDRFILDFAAKTGGVIVSNDNYRDIKDEKPDWTEVVNYRLLMYLFVGDIFMVPDDPLGRQGVNLETYLSFTS